MISSMKGQCSSGGLVMPPPSLTRRAIGLRLSVWERGNRSQNSAWSAVRPTNLRGTVASTVTHAAQAMRNDVRSAGNAPTSRGAMIKEATGTTIGEEGHLLTTTKKSPMITTAERVSAAALRLYSSTTKTRIDTTAQSTTLNHCANGATKLRFTTARRISHSSVPNRRYSQDPQQCGIDLLNYGKAANSLARELGFFDRIEKEHPELDDWGVRRAAKAEAQALIDTYFKRIPGAAKFIKGTYRIVADTKYVETFLGRRRWLRQIMDWNEKQEHIQHEIDRTRGKRDLCWCNDCQASRDGERRSVNTIIQGTAADIVMCAMIKCFYDNRLNRLGVKMLLQIHDELVFECPEENVDEACPIIQENMEHPGLNLRVPLKAAPGVGDNWVMAK